MPIETEMKTLTVRMISLFRFSRFSVVNEARSSEGEKMAKCSLMSKDEAVDEDRDESDDEDEESSA